MGADSPHDAGRVQLLPTHSLAAADGLYVALVPTWGDKLTAPWGDGPRLFRLDNLKDAHSFTRYLAQRLKGRTNVMWILGGDRPPQGGADSSLYLKDEPWLSVNGMQSGHGSGHDVPVWEWIARDYAMKPPKPAGSRT
jgi:Protein of unknown function (DUF4038)